MSKTDRNKNDMKALKLIFLSFCFIIANPLPLIAENFTVVDNEYLWFSSNLTEVLEHENQEERITNDRSLNDPPLSELVYNRYFDQHGFPPPLDFLRPLKKGASPVAQIEDQQIIFPRTGRRIALNTSSVPLWADAATPYLLSNPGTEGVLVVYPYYFYQCKDNSYYTEVYSDSGTLLYTFDTLPTHVSVSNSHLLVSSEKSGCCDSLRWSVRFYNLYEGSMLDLSCPEGFCGDVLFTRLGEEGPFIVAQEILGVVSEIGASLQINISIVDQDGTLLASGKIIHAVYEPNLQNPRIQSLSPYAISKLLTIEPLSKENNWLIHFGGNTEKRVLRLVSTSNDTTPAVVFLLSNEPARGLVKTAEKTLGNLPLLGISDPGLSTFSIFLNNGSTDKVVTSIKSDEVNIVTH